MLRYIGKITPKSKALLQKSIIMLKWDDPSLEEIIFDRICPSCRHPLQYADRWYRYQQCVVFKRLCVRCRKLYILAGEFNRQYRQAKEYFIGKFRMNKHNKTVKKKWLN